MPIDEDEQAFIERRLSEERQMMKESSCIVRSVHEEMVELYDERAQATDANTAEFEALLDQIEERA